MSIWKWGWNWLLVPLGYTQSQLPSFTQFQRLQSKREEFSMNSFTVHSVKPLFGAFLIPCPSVTLAFRLGDIRPVCEGMLWGGPTLLSSSPPWTEAPWDYSPSEEDMGHPGANRHHHQQIHSTPRATRSRDPPGPAPSSVCAPSNFSSTKSDT